MSTLPSPRHPSLDWSTAFQRLVTLGVHSPDDVSLTHFSQWPGHVAGDSFTGYALKRISRSPHRSLTWVFIVTVCRRPDVTALLVTSDDIMREWRPVIHFIPGSTPKIQWKANDKYFFYHLYCGHSLGLFENELN